MLNIEVADHLIIDENDYYSFALHGDMSLIKISGKYEIMSDKQKKLLKLRSEHEKAITIAKKLQEMGIDEESIRKATGLRKVDLENM